VEVDYLVEFRDAASLKTVGVPLLQVLIFEVFWVSVFSQKLLTTNASQKSQHRCARTRTRTHTRTLARTVAVVRDVLLREMPRRYE